MITDLTITDLQVAGNNITELPDRPGEAGYSPAQLKAQFDKLPQLVKTRFNSLVSELIDSSSGTSGAEQLGSAAIDGVAGNTIYQQVASIKAQLTELFVDERIIPNGSITTDKLAGLAVTTAKIAEGAVTDDKIDVDYILDGGTF